MFHYDNNCFIAISVITMVSLTIAFVITIRNIIRHALANYTRIRKRSIMVIFTLEIVLILSLITSLWIYAECEPILIFWMTLCWVIFFSSFQLLKETLMVYASKFARENPQFLDQIVEQASDGDKEWALNHTNMMKNKIYPFNDITGWRRFSTADSYIALWYYLEGVARIHICWRRKMPTYKAAYRFHSWRNTFSMFLFIWTVPLANTIDYILEKNNMLNGGKINFVIITRGYIFFATTSIMIKMQSFVLSFKKILPFIDLNKIQVSLLSLLGNYYDSYWFV